MERETAVVLALLVAPVPLILIVALIRGYTIHVLMRREDKRRDE